MDASRFKERWPVLQAKLRQKFDVLTEDDVTWRRGHADELMEHIAARVGRTAAELEHFLDLEIASMDRAGAVLRTMTENARRLGTPRDLGGLSAIH